MSTTKKLLIIAGAGPHVKAVEAAHELDLYTIVTDNLPKGVESPAKVVSDECADINIFDVEGLIDFCRLNGVSGVLGLSIDPAQRVAYKVANALGLPTFGTWEQVFALTDKNAFRELCVKNGVDVVPQYYEDALTDIEYPVLVKPADSRGSRGITICDDSSTLDEAISLAKKESSCDTAIIEKYMANNQEITITYVVKEGAPYLVSLGDRFPGKKEDNLDRQNSYVVQPSRFSELYMNRVNENVINMIKSLGIKNGPVFMQGFVDGDTVRMFDPGIRFPGNEYERIFKEATGMNIIKSMVSYVSGGEIIDYNGALENSYNLDGKLAIQYMVNLGAGKIAKFDGLDKMLEHKNIIDVQQRHFVGEKIENTGDIKHRAAEISILINRDVTELVDVISYIQNNVVVVDDTNGDMIISMPDLEEIRELYF